MIHPVDFAPSQAFGDNPTRNLPASSWIIQAFGNYQPDGHSGVDYPCPVGTQVRAVADGMVLHVGWMGGSYADNPWWIQPSFAGYVYVVDHGSFIGIYGHCKDASNWVNVGDRVTEGQTLGLSGNTGASTGPHLHFEALPDGYNLYGPMYGRIDPIALIGSLSYAGTITPVQEDDMATVPQAEWEWAKQVLTALSDNAATKKDLRDVVEPRTLAPNEKEWQFAVLRSLADNVATKGDADRIASSVASVAAQKASEGATVEQITEAVKQAIAESVVTVDVNVGGK